MSRERERNVFIIIVIVVIEFLSATSSSVGYFIFRQDTLNARAVFRIVVERVDILIAINFYLHSNFTVQISNGSAR